MAILLATTLAAFAALALALSNARDDSPSQPVDQIGVAAAPLTGGLAVSGELRRGRAWSAIKVPLVAAYIDWRRTSAGTADGVSALNARERSLIERALTRSDNDAASRLFWTMAGSRHTPAKATRRIEAIHQRAGDHHTQVRTQFGTSSSWPAPATRHARSKTPPPSAQASA